MNAAVGGPRRLAVCAFLCMAFALLSPLLPRALPKGLRVALLPGILLSLFPLWPLLYAELGERRGPALFALAVAVTLLLCLGSRPLFVNASLPVGILALLCVGCILFAERDTNPSEPLFSSLGAYLCPLSAFLALPSVCAERRLRVLLPSVACGVVLAIPLSLFGSPLCECMALLAVDPLCACAMLRIFCGKQA